MSPLDLASFRSMSAEAHDPSQDQVELEVRWMSSGATACRVLTSSKAHLLHIKSQVHEKAGIPVKEQRMFSSTGQELADNAELGTMPEVLSEKSAHSKKYEELERELGAKALLLVRCVSDPRITDLSSFRIAHSFPALPIGGFNMIRKLSTGIHGDIFLYKWHFEDRHESVAVKMLRNDCLSSSLGTETDEFTIHTHSGVKAPLAEDALTEIGILSHLSLQADLPASLLEMRGVFVDSRFTWLVTEYCDDGELFQVAVSGAVAEPKLCHYLLQLLQAVSYLHSHDIGHRDISLENILLKGEQIKLMDFGMAVRSHSASGTPLRYFRAVGKDFYRAPECHVPRTMERNVKVPETAKGGDVIFAKTSWRGDPYLCEVRLPLQAQSGENACKADIWGYTTGPADVWAVAICFFILGFQCPPWNWAMLDDPSFCYAYGVDECGSGSGLEDVLKNWGKQLLSQEAMRLLKDMLKPDPARRPCASECIQNDYFAGVGHPQGFESSAAGCDKADDA